jgi:hypothetical protein
LRDEAAGYLERFLSRMDRKESADYVHRGVEAWH